MEINNEEITKKCDVEGCNYTHVFTSGTDFPVECWLTIPQESLFLILSAAST